MSHTKVQAQASKEANRMPKLRGQLLPLLPKSATRLFNFLQTNNGECNNHDILCNLTSPVPFLIQVPTTNMVQFICGIAPYKGDLFSGQRTSNVEGQLLGLLHEPAVAGDTPKVDEQPQSTSELANKLHKYTISMYPLRMLIGFHQYEKPEEQNQTEYVWDTIPS